MTRILYRYNVETGERRDAVPVDHLKAYEIAALEDGLWVDTEWPWVVRDSINDDVRIARPAIPPRDRVPPNSA